MKISFETNGLGEYIDPNADKFVNTANGYLRRVFGSLWNVSTDQCIEELSKIVACQFISETRVSRGTSTDKKWIIEVEIDEKDYLFFLLKYSI